MTSRFDYVKFDKEAIEKQAYLKDMFENIEDDIKNGIDCPQNQLLALGKLEECYMWVGKGIRSDLIKRNGSAPLQDERCDS